MAAQHLQAVAAAVKGLVGESRLHDGGDQSAPGVRKVLLLRRAVPDAVELDRGLVGQHATGIHPGALGVEHASDGRVIGDPVGSFAAGRPARSAHLASLLGVGMRFLPCSIQQANTLQRHMQSGGIHHHEHGLQAPAGFAHQPACSSIKAHHTGGAAVQAHFFLDAFAMHGTAGAVRIELGHQKQGQPLRAGGRIGQPGQHQMHDVVGQVVFAARNENFGATEGMTAISDGDGAGRGQAQIGAGMGLGQAHRGQPFTGRNFGQIKGFEFIAGVVQDAFVGAVQQSRRHRPAMVGP